MKAEWGRLFRRCPTSLDRCFLKCPIREDCERGWEAHEKAMDRIDEELIEVFSRILDR